MDDDSNWDPPMYYEDEEIPIYEETFYQTYEYCMKPTLIEIIPYIWKLFLCNLIFRVFVKTIVIPKKLCHIISTVCGSGILYLLLRSSLPYIAFFIIFCFVALKIICWIFSKHSAYILSFVYIAYLIGSEFYFPVPSIWIETRGLHMVIAMKYLSLMFDVQNGVVKTMPDVMEVAGYIFCPSNCILGPWVSYDTYKNLFEHRMNLLNLSWFKQFVIAVFTAILFLTLSNCWAAWTIPHTFKWSVAYQEALSFRSSHYFISFLAEAVLLIGGYGYDEKTKKTDENSCAVTKPIAIEFPRSLVQVVIYWNMPMHMWLKNYVFRVSRPLGSFAAVIITYLVSSFLHGCNLKLAAVLLSLGFYTYVEYKFRNKISFIFSACIKANPCKKCTHKYRTHVYVQCTNIAFSALAVFHLAYLGCLIESLSDTYNKEEYVFEKWRELGYASHIVTGLIYLIYKLI